MAKTPRAPKPKLPKPAKSLGQHIKDNTRKAAASGLRQNFGMLGDAVAKKYLSSPRVKSNIKVETVAGDKKVHKKPIKKTESSSNAVFDSGKQVSAAIEVVAANASRSFAAVSRQTDTMGEEVTKSMNELASVLDRMLYRAPTSSSPTTPDGKGPSYTSAEPQKDDGSGIPWLKLGGGFLSRFLKGGAKAAGAIAVYEGLKGIKSDSQTGNKTRTWLRGLLGIQDPGEAAPWKDSLSNKEYDDLKNNRTPEPTPETKVKVGGGDNIIQKMKYTADKITFKASGKIEFKSKSGGSSGGATGGAGAGKPAPAAGGSVNRMIDAVRGGPGGSGTVNSGVDAIRGGPGGSGFFNGLLDKLTGSGGGDGKGGYGGGAGGGGTSLGGDSPKSDGKQVSVPPPTSNGTPPVAGTDKDPNIIDRTDSGLASGGDMKNVQGLVVHHTSGRENIDQIIAGLKSRTDVSPKGASVQYFVDRDGKTYQLMPDGKKAFHAGGGTAPDGTHVGNATHIGVEVAAKNDKDVTPTQQEAVARLNAFAAKKYGYDPKKDVYGHGDFQSSERKDPGRDSKENDEGRSSVSRIKRGDFDYLSNPPKTAAPSQPPAAPGATPTPDVAPEAKATPTGSPAVPPGYKASGLVGSHVDKDGKLSSFATSMGRSKIITSMGSNFDKLPKDVQDHVKNDPQLDLNRLAPHQNLMPPEMKQDLKDNGLEFTPGRPASSTPAANLGGDQTTPSQTLPPIMVDPSDDGTTKDSLAPAITNKASTPQQRSDNSSSSRDQSYMQDAQKEVSELDHRPRQAAVQQQSFGDYTGTTSGSEDTA